jgi:hypothetical protein
MTKPLEDRRVSLSILPGAYNVLREPLRPDACWSLGESTFAFGETFVGRGAKKDFVKFRALRDKYPDAVVALFGHTDPVGKEDFNHDLGALRARAVYGVLVRDPEIWFEMYAGNLDALAHVKKRLRSSGYEIPKDEQGVGPATRAAITKHIEELAGPMQMAPEEFLGEHGQYSMQSCSEFNPLRRSSDELDALLDPAQRIVYQRPNRRVLAFFFPPQTHVDGWWPCPRPGDGVAGCKPRFWSDAKTRRSTKRTPREFVPRGLVGGGPVPPVVAVEDTFACRFYDRIAHASPCERAKTWIPPKPADIYIIMDPEIIHIDPPPPPVKPTPPGELEQIVLMCSHLNRYNSGYLGHTDGPDRIEIVPQDEDLVLAVADPAHDVLWSIKPDATPDTGPEVWIGVEQFVPSVGGPTGPSFLELMRIEPAVRVVEATWNKKSIAVEIHAYPFDPYERDLEDTLADIHSVFLPAIKAWAIIGDLLVDGIEVNVLDPADCDFTIFGAWQEAPVGAGAPDFRAFFAHEIRLSGDPLISAEGRMSISLLDLLGKLGKVTPKIERLIEKLPEPVLKALKAVELEGEVGGAIGGALGTRRLEPGRTDSETARGSLTYEGGVTVGAGVDFAKFAAKLSFGVDVAVDLRVDFDREEVVVGLSGEFVDSRITVDIGEDRVFDDVILDGVALDRREFSLELADIAGREK